LKNLIIFDTETSGFPKNAPADAEGQAWICQLGFEMWGVEVPEPGPDTVPAAPDHFPVAGRHVPLIVRRLSFGNILCCSDKRKISSGAQRVHGISSEMCDTGIDEGLMCAMVDELFSNCDLWICHNFDFDIKLAELLFARVAGSREAMPTPAQTLCTMKTTTSLCKLPPTNPRQRSYKWPKLEELYFHLFGRFFEGAHDAYNDVVATRTCFFELCNRGHYALDDLLMLP
jgi:DNA polymerase-3 subunit epsilon